MNDYTGVLLGLLAQVHESTPVRDGLPDGGGQVIERGLDRSARDATTRRCQSIDQHLATPIVAEQREMRGAVDFGQPFAQSDEGYVH